jgi:hypothetical protein
MHANPKSHAHLDFPWHLSRTRRLVLWDLGLVLAIVLWFAFVVTRVDAAVLTGLSQVLHEQPAANSDEPILRSTDLATVDDLVAQLRDPISSVRVNAAQALASKHAVGATDALLSATYDSNVRVREEAAAALGDIGSVRALLRLQELQLTQGNVYIESAAFEAQGKILQNIAAALNVPASGIQAWGLDENGIAYAAALNELYVLHGEGWQAVSQLPATPNELWVGSDGRLLFMSTDSSGLYRSQDSGQTWEHLQYGLETLTQLTTTAVVVNPQNTDQIFVALAANGSNSDELSSLGITESNDGGKTWLALEDSPTWSVTRALDIDHTAPGYLYGLTDVGPWRYQLLSNGTNYQ